MELLEPLTKTEKRNLLLLVITDRYSKITRTIYVNHIKSSTVEREFIDNWIMPYRIPETISQTMELYELYIYSQQCEL